jgi:hypothetical protein
MGLLPSSTSDASDASDESDADASDASDPSDASDTGEGQVNDADNQLIADVKTPSNFSGEPDEEPTCGWWR